MKSIRWVILGLLFVASIINYIDRQSLSILARTIQDELNISEIGYTNVVQLFLLAYMLSFLVAGWITDKLGIRASMTLFIGWWSLANMATGWVRNAAQLGFARCVMPDRSLAPGDVPSGIEITGVRTVGEALDALL